jgi:predicted Ser/Thr protein kinase
LRHDVPSLRDGPARNAADNGLCFALMGRGLRSPDADTVDERSDDADVLRRASPSVDDFEGQRAKASIASRLFSGPAQPIRVGRYRILGRIGSGGMGVVYRAHDPELARDVAVKVVNPHSGGQDPRHAQARLVREARAMAKLAHPNVIHVYDVGTVDDGVFIAMELVEGRSLADWLRDGGHDWRETLRHFVEAGRGLAAAHAASVIHRDFKPHNVLLGDDGRVRVGDFGLAGGEAAGPTGPIAALSDDHEASPELDRASVSGTLTRTGMLLGTPKYMPPEQEAGGVASARSDQFSFCVALYEALYGRPPFAGDSVDVYRGNVRRGRVMPPPPDARVRSWVHTEIVRGLEVDPAARHPSMDALLDRLEGALDDPSAARRRRRRLRMAALGGLAAGTIGLALWGLDAPRNRDAAAAGPTVTRVETVQVPVPTPVPPTQDTSPGAQGEPAPVVDPNAEPPAPVPSPEAADPEAVAAPEEAPRPSPPKATGKRRSRPAAARDVCYFRQNNSKFITETKRPQSFVADARGRCWDCGQKAAPGATGGLNPNDCTAYYRCYPADSADSCSD